MPLFSYDAFAEIDDDPAHRQSIKLEEKKDDKDKGVKEPTNGTVEKKFLDNPTPNRFRIFLFKEFDKNNKEPYWKSNAKSYTTPIAIIYTEADKTYQPVRNIGRLWHHKGNYCFSCEKDYTIAEHHRESCKNKCSLCQRVGTKYPCKSEGISIKCPDCKRIFTNKECHQKHLAVYKGKKFNVCHRIRVCEKCSAVYHKHNGHNCRKRKEKTIEGGDEGVQSVKRQRKIDEFGI